MVNQTFKFLDDSVAVRVGLGDPWTVTEGDEQSEAVAHARIQNRFWKPWIKEALENWRITDE